jgi:hypothetical protein
VSKRALHVSVYALLLVFCAASPVLYAQVDRYETDQHVLGRQFRDSLNIIAMDSLILPGQFIRQSTFSIVSDAGDTLEPQRDYLLNPRTGELRILPAFHQHHDTSVVRVLKFQYRALPFSFAPVYKMRELFVQTDSSTGDTIQISSPSSPLNIESIFGSDLRKSGYIGRGFTVGSNRDLSLNSGFRLQLSGPLTDDISLVAALTDENTPIQPEGNTKTLQELDKVFIKIFNPNFALTLGDFNIAYTGTEFGKYNRKLAGFMGEARTDDAEASVSFASMKGSFRSMQFNGIDGVQGPYRLTGKNGEQRILVLAGTESIYVDGVLMERGETNDYVIEYANGELYFQPRRLITSYTRITVDFEYAEREYVRTMLAGRGSGKLFNDRLKISASYLSESDDVDSPIDLDISEDDKALLQAAGDDTQAAATSGVVFVGIDTSNGRAAGTYVKIDTTIEAQDYTLYRYQPGADSALYIVSFSFVGAGKGDYQRKSLGSYLFVGVNNGDYAPIRLLPLPRVHQLANLAIQALPIPEISIGAELGISDLDANRFSDKDDGDNTGTAYQLSLQSKFDTTAIGAFELQARLRSQGERFNPIDRINDIEFNRKWDISSASSATETIREVQAAYRPQRQMRISAGYGSFTKGSFSSSRNEAGLQLLQDSLVPWFPEANYSLEYIRSLDDRSATDSRWLRQKANAKYRTNVVNPFVLFEYENKENRTSVSDSLGFGSLSFVDVRPGLEFPSFGVLQATLNAGFRIEDGLIAGVLQKQSTDIFQQYSLGLRRWHDLSGNASVTIRNKSYNELFASAVNNDLETILTKVQLQYAPLKKAVKLDLLYDVSTERTSKLERVFLPVPFGQGNYVYNGDSNNNGIQDENEFEPTRFEGDYILLTVPTDELFPVIDLRSSFRLKLDPSKILTKASSNFWTGLARSISTDSYVRIDEKSEDATTSNIYLLKLGTFLNDSSTVQGFQNIRQDLFLFERNSDFSMRMRFDQIEGMNKYALSNERRYKREQSVRIKTQPVREIGIQSELIFLTDNVRSSDINSNRARQISSSTFKNDFSYRPERNVEVGFVFESKSASDGQYETPLEAAINSQTLRTSISFPGPGRLRVELERDEVVFNSSVERFPFELTDGKPEGKSWVWRVNFNYRITSYLQATAFYLGRSESNKNVVHTARAEVRAFF